MGVGRGAGGIWLPHGFRKCQKKEVVFLLSSGKKQNSPLLASPGKILKKSPGAPTWKKSFRRAWPDWRLI